MPGYSTTCAGLPEDGPALIIYYQGAIPIDMYYLVARVYLKRSRLVHTVGDRFLEKLPGWPFLARVMKIGPGTVQSCATVLKEGNMLSFSPGGVSEAQFGDSNYELLWRHRVDFAKVAIESKAPIIPMFTENLREGFRSIGFANRLFIRLCNVVRIPVWPVYGGFPVKFRTHLGKPIPYDPSLTPEELQEKVAYAVEELINKNQRIPGSILHGLMDRFIGKKKNECSEPSVSYLRKKEERFDKIIVTVLRSYFKLCKWCNVTDVIICSKQVK
ncbi:transmembrane protein 68-like [Toxorhynchites rutilus septentrionalis]|uniref:transmembrane protein 68-like n=1 Tax=Toxorhynchites rutilus septentrionalis TaxID=329112 RepID=UPI002478C1D7|nr:transmembrane protein 68-like [Toxorhynchites rutilus septentrionalis]